MTIAVRTAGATREGSPAAGSGLIRPASGSAGDLPVTRTSRSGQAGGLDETGGVPAVVSSTLEVRGQVPGPDPAGFLEAVDEAADLSPVSRLLAGAKIIVDAALESAP